MANKWKGLDLQGGYWKGLELQKVICGGGVVWQKNVVPIIEPILDLPFQNDFTDLTGINTMVAGRTSNLPTFELSGRKAGEYCAVFNGSQSIKTTTNLPVNSDKVTIAFWMKTTQTTVGTIAEMSENTNYNNTFMVILNNVNNSGKLGVYERISRYNNAEISNANNNTWKHIVAIIDRNKDATNGILIYVNGTLSFITKESTTDNNGNFVNNILFIGQRAGNSFGFIGSLTRLKIYNYPFTPSEVTNLYNSEL